MNTNDEMEARPEDAMEPIVAANSRPLPAPALRKNATPLPHARILLAMGVFFGLCIALYWILLDPQTRAQREQQELRAELYRTVTNAVSGKLKAPRTAIFCTADELQEDGYGVVKGYVDAQNGFGAMIRTKFRVDYDHTYSEKPFKVRFVNVEE